MALFQKQAPFWNISKNKVEICVITTYFELPFLCNRYGTKIYVEVQLCLCRDVESLYRAICT